MPEPRFTIETVKRIYDEKSTNDWIEIGPDADTGELIEIRSMFWDQSLKQPEIAQRVVIHPDAIDTLISVLETFKKV